MPNSPAPDARSGKRAPRRATVLVPAVAAVVALAAAGCSAAGGTGDGTTAAGKHGTAAGATPAAAVAWPDAVPKSGLAKGLVLPLEAYMETYPETVTIARAVDKLTESCMARYGFTLHMPQRGVKPPPNNDDANMARRYGISDPDAAAEYGYSLGEDDAQPDEMPKLSDAAVAVLTGHVARRPGAAKAPSTYQGKAVPEGGCATEAADKVGYSHLSSDLTEKLNAASMDRSQADPRVQQVIGAWSRCMRLKGYTVDSPLHAADLVPQSGTGGNAVQTATTDVACKKHTGLVKTWFDVESAIERDQIEQNQLALQQQRDTVTAAVKAAAAVIG